MYLPSLFNRGDAPMASFSYRAESCFFLTEVQPSSESKQLLLRFVCKWARHLYLIAWSLCYHILLIMWLTKSGDVIILPSPIEPLLRLLPGCAIPPPPEGQASVLHCWVSCLLPVQSSPVLVFVWVPPPHVSEQSDQLVQSPQMQPATMISNIQTV